MHLDGFRPLKEIQEFGVSRGQLARLVVFTCSFAAFEGVGITLLLPALELAGGGRPTSWLSRTVFRLLPFPPSERPVAALASLLLFAFVPLGLRSLLQWFRDAQAIQLKFQLATQVRERVAEAIAHADVSFFLAHDRGALQAALTSESDRTVEALSTRLVFLATFAMTSVYVALLGVISWRLTLCALPALLLVAAVFRRLSASARRHSDVISREQRTFGQEASNVLQGIQLIKMRGAEEWAVQSLQRSIREIASNVVSIERLRALVEMGLHPFIVLAALAILFLSVVAFRMSLANLGLYLFIMVRLIPQLILMNSLWAHMHGFYASSRNLDALVMEAREHREPAGGGRPVERLQSGVAFRGVSFRYPTTTPGRYQLQDVSFTLERGRMTALVGRSGAGKTTLAYLLTGLHAPTEGQILIDGTPLEELDRRSWRRRIGLVPQEPFFFNRSIRWNLEFGSERHLDDEAMRSLLEQTHCSFVERLPDGIDTEVGERGVRLSQGQRQRLAIAHAVACGNELLVLDEPTSALDAESEAALQATFEQWHGKMTMLVIAHRLSTIRHAAQILVLDDGQIAARGSHDELMATSELYRTLFETQLIVR